MQTDAKWSISHKIIFYFCVIFFGLNIFPFPITVLPFFDFLYSPLDEYFWNPIVQFSGKVFLGLKEVTSRPNGSGDTTWNWLQQLAILVIAAIGSIAWIILAKNKNNHEKLHYWVKILFRYYLAFTMILYGVVKIFPLQFGTITTYRLYERLGEMSPMGLLWTFMAHSEGYQMFSGFAEVIGAFLLLSRRTTTLGAMVCAGVLMNIFALNVFYDVPVKIYSFWLLLLAIYLIFDDIKRLLQFFVLNQATKAKDEFVFSDKKWFKISNLLAKGIFIIIVCGIPFYDSWENSKRKDAPKTAIYGAYSVQSFERNNTNFPSDTLRWQEVFIDRRGAYDMVFVTNEDGLRKRIDFRNDVKKHQLFLTDYISVIPDTTQYAFQYMQVDSSTLFLKGKFKTDSVKVLMKKMNRKDFLLNTRGFHWVNEFPFNK